MRVQPAHVWIVVWPQEDLARLPGGGGAQSMQINAIVCEACGSIKAMIQGITSVRP